MGSGWNPCTSAPLGNGTKLAVIPLVPLREASAFLVMPFWRRVDFPLEDWELILGMFVIYALEIAPQSNVQSV